MCHHEKATKISKKIISHFTGVILFWDRILSTALWSEVLFVPCDVDFVKIKIVGTKSTQLPSSQLKITIY